MNLADENYPLTQGAGDQVHAQREYVEAIHQGFGFSAHGDRWLYASPDRSRLAVLYVRSGDTVTAPIKDKLKWIEEAAKL